MNDSSRNSLRPTSVCDTTPLQDSLEVRRSGNYSSGSGSGNSSLSTPTFNVSDTNTATITNSTISSGELPESEDTSCFTTPAIGTIMNGGGHLLDQRRKSHSGTIEICVNDCLSADSQLTKNKLTDNMEYQTSRQVFGRLCVDLIVLCCVGMPIMCFHVWGEPYHRGFFCDDTSLRHPYKDSSVPAWLLHFMGFVIPIGLITAIEFFNANNNYMHGFGRVSGDHYYIGVFQLPDYIVECYKKIGALLFGAGVCQLTSEIAKYSIGRLRPHFFAVCQPIMLDKTTCDDPINAGRYIEEFMCRGGPNVTPRMLKELGLSFPSGHANYSFYTMVYIAIYLQRRMTWQRTKMFKHLLQFFFIMFAWYTALTRVSDYKHHWTDVLAGSAIGSVYAVIVTSMW